MLSDDAATAALAVDYAWNSTGISSLLQRQQSPEPDLQLT